MPLQITSIIFFRNKDIILTITCLSQVRRETEFSPRTGKPNKTASKTAPDNRQSFINKDVLSMKIITAAKQNMAQDPELLSEVCQQTLFKETVQQRGQGWRHSSAFLSFFYLDVPLNLFKFQRCDLPSCVQRGSKGSRGFPAVPITRDDVSASSARLPCVISAGFLSSGGKGEGDKSRKTGRLKSTITLFFFFFQYHLLRSVDVWNWSSQDPWKQHFGGT